MEAVNFSALCLMPSSNRPSDVAMFLSCGDGGVMLQNPHHMCGKRRCDLNLGGNFGVGNKFVPALHGHLLRAMPLTQSSTRSRSLTPCQVTREDSGGSLSGESILLNEQTLERELQLAVESENYSQAAKIRDSLKLLQEDSKSSVLAANARFYNSFRNGDLAAMEALWSKGDHVCVVHPGVSGISGRDLVMGSWEFVWADYEFPLEIEIRDVQVHVRGGMGYVTCIEMVKTKGSSWGRHFATNVFEKVDGQWFICTHHASYVDL